MKKKWFLALCITTIPFQAHAASWDDYDPREAFSENEMPELDWFDQLIDLLDQGNVNEFKTQLRKEMQQDPIVAYEISGELEPLFHKAIKKNLPEAVEYLLEINPDLVMELDEEDGALIHLAQHHDNPAIAQLLLDYDADIDLINQDGWTALMMAINDGRTHLAQFLAKRGARLTPRQEQTVMRQSLNRQSLLNRVKQIVADRKQTISKILRPRYLPQDLDRLISEF